MPLFELTVRAPAARLGKRGVDGRRSRGLATIEYYLSGETPVSCCVASGGRAAAIGPKGGLKLVVAFALELEQAKAMAEGVVQQREAAEGMLTRRCLEHGARGERPRYG